MNKHKNFGSFNGASFFSASSVAQLIVGIKKVLNLLGFGQSTFLSQDLLLVAFRNHLCKKAGIRPSTDPHSKKSYLITNDLFHWFHLLLIA